MLSREISTALRGRAVETVIFPFSFKEFLTHNGQVPPPDPAFLAKSEVSALENAVSNY
jgi:predicted AAA+ superfamily ATPase